MRDDPTKDQSLSRGRKPALRKPAARKPGAREPAQKPPKPAGPKAKSFRGGAKAASGASASAAPKRSFSQEGGTRRDGDDPRRIARSRPAPRKDRASAELSKPRAAPVVAPGDGEGPGSPQRIAKVMARAGACSRRDAERWIAEGRVALNGDVLTDPAINVRDGDAITVDGEPLAPRAATRLFLFHKPRGLVATERDPEGRPTIFDYLRDHWPEGPRVVSVGRLDINTEGLLLLTNDGGLARVLELPATGWLRRYRVRAKGETDQGALDRLREGVAIDGVDYAGVEATLDRLQGANAWLTIGLREGKNREIKRVLEHIGLLVNRLIRISFGPFQLGDIAEGAVEEIRTRVLRDQLGPLLAKAAGADFSSPREEPDVARAGAPPAKTLGLRRERPQGLDRPGGRPAGERPRRAAPAEKAAGTGIKSRPAPGPRKHISALRLPEGDLLAGGRKRVERAETADRSGRTIHVERLVAAAPAGKRSAGRDASAAPATRNGRRFEAERRNREDDSRSASAGRSRFSDAAAAASNQAAGGKAARFQRRSSERAAEAGAQGERRERQPQTEGPRFGRTPRAGGPDAGPARPSAGLRGANKGALKNAPREGHKSRAGSKFAPGDGGRAGPGLRPGAGKPRTKPGGPAPGKTPGPRSRPSKGPRTGRPPGKR